MAEIERLRIDKRSEHSIDEEAFMISNGSASPASSINGDSAISDGSSSCSSSVFDTSDDACSSSTTNSLDSQSSVSLYDLSDLMAQLPIKRGLSKYYDGKSQSFTSLSRVESIEDLPKKRRKMKRTYRSYTLDPKPIISKKTSKSSSFPSRRGNSNGNMCCRPPLIPLQKNFGC